MVYNSYDISEIDNSVVDEVQDTLHDAKNMLKEGVRINDETIAIMNRADNIVLDTEETGIDTLHNLNNQRDTLVRTKDILHRTKHSISKIRKNILWLSSQLLRDKCIVILILLILLVSAIILFWKIREHRVYLKYGNKSNNTLMR